MEATEIQQHEIAEIEEFAAKRDTMLGEIRKVIVGQDHVIEEVLIALFARGHCLLVGVPGLAKTLLISTLAEILRSGLQPHPVHPRPDAVRHHRHRHPAGGRRHRAPRSFSFCKGPIFANILLADEINRTPPKTQAALLQAMQEYKVTAGGTHLSARTAVLRAGDAEPHRAGRHLSAARSPARPLHVQHRNRLPELRRRSADRHADDLQRNKPAPKKIMDGAAILRYQELVRKVPVSPFVVSYAVALAQRSRPQSADAPQFVKDYVEWGAGPRASQYLDPRRQGAHDPPGPLCRVASKTSRPSRHPCCATASCPTSKPKAKASLPSISSTACWYRR